MNESAIITLVIPSLGVHEDLEIPLDITALDLIRALNAIYGLGRREEDLYRLYLKADSPKRLLAGEMELQKAGIRNGTVIRLWNENYG